MTKSTGQNNQEKSIDLESAAMLDELDLFLIGRTDRLPALFAAPGK